MRRIIRRLCVKLSKSRALRDSIPFLKTMHSAHVLNEMSAKIKLNHAYTNFVRSWLFWKWAPRKYCGGGILNFLGLSIIRYYFYNLRYCFRFRGKKELDFELKNNGIKICPSFLSKAELNNILSFYEKNKSKASTYFNDFSELIVCNTKGSTARDLEYENLTKYIIDLTKEIGERITGKKFALKPFISFIHYKSNPDSVLQEDGQNIPHFDVFYPSYKIFIYLNEVNEDNGGFRYLVGSHKFSLDNAKNYYKDCLNHYFFQGKKSLYPTDATKSIYPNDFKWLNTSGKAGDAVIFNVQGIHRRGEFKKDIYRERIVLLIDFRQIEVPFQNLATNV